VFSQHVNYIENCIIAAHSFIQIIVVSFPVLRNNPPRLVKLGMVYEQETRPDRLCHFRPNSVEQQHPLHSGFGIAGYSACNCIERPNTAGHAATNYPSGQCQNKYACDLNLLAG
jgi:hypothetical protein